MKYPGQKLAYVILLIILSCTVILKAETIILNNRQFEKIDGQWYQLDGSFKYQVDYTVITVKYKDSVTDAEKNAKNQDLNCSVVRVNMLGYYDLQIPEGSDPLQLVQEYMSSELVKIAEPNAIGVYNTESNDPLYPEQWHHHDENEIWGIDSYKAWDKETGNPNIKIAVIDSGSDIFHEDLKGNIWVNPGEDLDGDGIVWDSNDLNGIDDDNNGFIDDLVGWDFYNNNNDATGTNNHGTHVAGIVGAATNNSKGVAGVAGGWSEENQGCSMLIASLGYRGEGSVLDDAILYAAMNGAKIITLSIGLPPSYAIEDAIETAYINYGVFINCASGNDDRPSLSFPASNEYVVAVGGSNQEGNRIKKPDYYWGSNYGEGLMVVAPGVDIWSTKIGNNYSSGAGTSYSSPQVAATAGMIASRFPSFTNKDIEKVICLTAMKLPAYNFDVDKEYGTWNFDVGYGKLNADRALGITGTLTKPQTLVEGNYFYGEVDVANNTTLTFTTNSRTYLFDQAKLVIQEGSNTIVNEGSNIQVLEKSQAYIMGDLSMPSNSIVKIGENSELRIQQISDFIFQSGSTLKLQQNSKLIIENGSHLVFEPGAVVELSEGAEIIVGTKAYFTANGTTFSYVDASGKWLGINAISGSSVELNNVNITGAETGVRGEVTYKFKVTNSIFQGCTNGIGLIGMQPGYDYIISDNTLTGIDDGRGISITSADGVFSRNVISHFNTGANFIMSSPIVSKCKFTYNKYYGIVISGNDALPILISTEDNQPFGVENCTIEKNAYMSNTSIFPSAQIGIIPVGSVYMRYNDVISSPNFLGISIAQKDIMNPDQIITIDATLNYWGTEDVTDDYFFGHPQYIIKYDPTWSLVDEDHNTLNRYVSTESRILINALNLEAKDKLTPAIKLYEHIIKKYVDSPEYYVALARLPYLYEKAELDNNELITLYNEAIQAENTSHKKFFMGKKVATHIKGTRYDDAILVAEAMKNR